MMSPFGSGYCLAADAGTARPAVNHVALKPSLCVERGAGRCRRLTASAK
jgi:hypothetical protein